MDPLGISVVPRVPKDHCLIKVSWKMSEPLYT